MRVGILEALQPDELDPMARPRAPLGARQILHLEAELDSES